MIGDWSEASLSRLEVELGVNEISGTTPSRDEISVPSFIIGIFPSRGELPSLRLSAASSPA